MLLRDLKKNMLLPDKEIFINKTVKIRERDIHLISITMEEHRNVLWLMYQEPEEVDLEERKEYTTNKDEMIDIVNNDTNKQKINISEITIQDQKMSFSSSYSSRVDDYEKYMLMQHFVEKGLTTIDWDELYLDSIWIKSYIQEESEEFPSIDLSEELDIIIKVNEESMEVLINQPIYLEYGEMEKGNKYYFYDSIEKKNRIYYINKIENYDIWEDANNKFEKEFKQVLPQEQYEQMKEEYISNLEEICPKGMNLAMLEYEAEDDIQLNFYSNEFLSKKPVYISSSSGYTFIFRSDKKFGVNGFRSRLCMIKPVKKDFRGSIDAELFSWYSKIPEEIIKV